MLDTTLASRQWQWGVLALATVLAVLRTVLDGQRWSLAAVLVAALVLGLVCLGLAPTPWSRLLSEGLELQTVWKRLPKVDQRLVRHGVKHGEALRPDLIGPAEVFARVRVRNGARLPWTFGGFAMIASAASFFPWSLLPATVGVIAGALVVLQRNRWERQHRSVLEQGHLAAD